MAVRVGWLVKVPLNKPLTVAEGTPFTPQLPAVLQVLSVVPLHADVVVSTAKAAGAASKTRKKRKLIVERVGVFMWMDAGWLVGGLRVFESLLRRVWDGHSTRALLGKITGKVTGMELRSVVFPKNIPFGNRTHVRYLN